MYGKWEKMVNKFLLISLSLQILFFLLFFSTILARLPEPVPSIISLLIACMGLITSIISIIKGQTSKLAFIVLGASLLMFLMFVFAMLLSGM